MKFSKQSMFLRRVRGLKKKTSELATLCGVDALLICYDHGGSDQPCIPQTWPEKSDEVQRIVTRYRDHLLQESTKMKRKRQNPVADDNQNKKRRRFVDAHKEDISVLDGFTSDKLQELLKLIDSKLEKVNEMMREKSEEKSLPAIDSKLDTVIELDNWSSETEPSITSLASAPNQDFANTSGDSFDVYHCESLPDGVGLGSPLHMPYLCDSSGFNDDSLLTQFQKEKRDQSDLSSSEIEYMIRFLKSLENGDCLCTSMPDCCLPFIPQLCSSDSMGSFMTHHTLGLAEGKTGSKELSN